MKAFALAVLALAAIAWGANMALKEVGFSSADRAASSDVRLGDGAAPRPAPQSN